jgi:predicted anti-sigma-YlaC factor YlaD
MLTSVPNSDCMRAREAVSLRLDGELDELETARLSQHLRDCADCRAFAAASGAVTRQLRAATLEPAPAGLFLPSRRRRVPTPFAAAAASLVIAAATGSSFLLGQVLGSRSGGGAATATAATTVTAASAVRADPGLLAMLRSLKANRPTTGRVIAL